MGLVLVIVLALLSPPVASDAPVDDPLGPIIVEATPGDDPVARLPVLRIGTRGPLVATALPWTRVLRRDLELFGGFDIREVTADSDGAWLGGAAAVELQCVVDDAGGRLVVRVFSRDGTERWHRELPGPPSRELDAHALADDVLEALTGLEGGFASRLAFARTVGSTRRVYAVDVDGRNLDVVSPATEVAASPTFDAKGRLVYASSVDQGRFRIRIAGEPSSTLDLGGSVYGIAFSPDGKQSAVTVARGRGITLLVGTSTFDQLRRASKVSLAMHPAFGPSGTLAYVGEAGTRPRVFVGDRPVSARGASASAPEFCNHPDRPRLLWAERVGRRWVLVRADAHGRNAERISAGWGDARWPACSPDGRMVAFFSSGGTRQPGLYITNIDHFAPRRVASMVGSSLHWSGRRPTQRVVAVDTEDSSPDPEPTGPGESAGG